MEAVGYDLYCKMLNEAVKTLKGTKKIDEDFSPRLIHTVRGVGYVLKDESD